jgi:hypothetical protein
MSTTVSDLEEFRAQIARILASPEFASSRHLQEFLRFTSEKAFLGVTHLEQTEIAMAVLGRGADFNPVEDASVRKMASQVRQRLDNHYSRREAGSEHVVVLPVRSYIPRLERRVEESPAPAPQIVLERPAPAVVQPASRSFHWWAVAAAAAIAIVAGFVVFGPYPGWDRRTETDASPIVLSTVKGDIIQGGNLAPGAGVQLGPQLGEVDEITARLDFTPRMEAQQAGLIIWQDVHHFIRLGRKFFGRNQIEFLLEQGRTAVTTPVNTVYDGEGQSGQPLWLSIRRDGNEYRAFLSRDGRRWEQHGEPIVPAEPFAAPRAGIFALNGRRDAPSIQASFSHLSTGVTFAGAPGASIEPYSRGGWTTIRTCPDSTTSAIEGLSLRIAFPPNLGDCNFEVYRALNGRDWDVTTRMDFLPLPGRSAGLRVAGSKASIRLVRYSLNGPAIAFIQDGRALIGGPDLNGSPTLYLRLRSTAGVLSASYSADGERFVRLPVKMNVEELGANVRAGIRFSTSITDQEEPSSTSRFYWFREAVQSLTPYR